MISYDEALALLKEYNQGEFHLKHAYIVSDVMGWFAEQLGYGEEKEFWSIVGLLHDLDFEQYPRPALHQIPGDHAGTRGG